MIDLKLHHIGEPLVARMLQKLEAAGRLSSLACERTHVSVEDDIAAGRLERPIEFLAEKASLSILANGGDLTCDGAQKVDVLCGSSGQRAMAFELKLGEERLRTNEFQSRFLRECSTSHAGSRLKGTMISVLDRRFLGSDAAVLCASVSTNAWEVVRPWWLVVRKVVWLRWAQTGIPSLTNGRFLLLEKVVQEFGGEEAFNDLVRELVCGNFFEAWGIGQ
jgi:hypothetical protein